MTAAVGILHRVGRRSAVVAAVATLVVVEVVGFFLRAPEVNDAERRTDAAAVANAPLWAHVVATFIGKVLAPEGAVVIVLVIAVVTGLRSSRPSTALVFAARTLLPATACELLKLVVQRPGPNATGPHVPPSMWSYPSGHAATTTAIVLGVLFLMAPVLRTRPVPRVVAVVAAVVVIAAVALSRVVLGVHYPTDVVAGPICSVAFVVLVARVFPDRREARRASGTGPPVRGDRGARGVRG
jgi:membrane-associated phospholipid phosphatase